MKFCQKCGKEIMDQAVMCPNCGCAVTPAPGNIQNNQNDKVNVGLVILSALFPIVGVILWPVMHSKVPRAARIYGLTGIIAWAVSFVLLMILGGF